MQIEINGQLYNVIINRKKNKNTYIRVNAGDIVVSTSLHTSIKDINRLINANIDRLEKMLNRKSVIMDEANVIFYKGHKYNVVVISSHNEVLLDGDKIYGPSTKKINAWYNTEMNNYFQSLLDSEYSRFTEKIPYPKLKIRKMKSRWGVCNRREISVTLNSHLMKYSEDVIRYVIIHELAHFVHFDHSSNFWNLVSFYCPHYKQLKKILKG